MICRLLILLLLGCFAASASAQHRLPWTEAYRQADSLLTKLTLDEKIHFMRSYSSFFFFGVPSKGIPHLYLSDATQGIHLRENLPDTTMVRQLERSTAFPCPLMLAATFDPGLAWRYAEAVGQECRAGGIEVLLGPGVNITRNAQCGRNFEYFGEDPLLSARMTESYVRGLQSTGTAACLKHFICNETEFYRRRSNSCVDERALHEIYLPPFQAGINAGATYVMTSYNQINGEWTGQNQWLIEQVLRGELGFRGCVMSDWSSVYDTEKVIRSGQNVEMPGRRELFREVRELLAAGRISECDLDRMIRPNLATAIAWGFYDRQKYRPELLAQMPAHAEVAYEVAAQGTVLLRNNGILPLKPGQRILLTGRFVDEVPRSGGNTAASAEVLGYDNITLLKALQAEFGDAIQVVEHPTREELEAADVVLLSVGTVDIESFERPFALPRHEERFIRQAVAANPRTVILVNSGSGIRMSGWNEQAAAILYGWYPGQNGMMALARILAGKINPSGKLPMTIERDFSDSPARGTMPAGAEFYNDAPRAYNERLIGVYDVDYAESVLVGYRWYETRGIKPLYPFGFGLSYTTFALTKARAEARSSNRDKWKVHVTVSNTGECPGAEVVQLYVSQRNPRVVRPLKELKDFRKVELASGESREVVFELDRQALAYWDSDTHAWRVDPGEYVLSLGTSSAEVTNELVVNIKK